MNWTLLAALFVGVVVVAFFLRLLLTPIRWVLRLALNGAVGLALLWLVNQAGGYFNLHIGLNPITALTVGLLGIPGVILLVALHYIL